MKTTTKQQSDTNIEIKVVLDASDLQPSHEAAVKRLADQVKLHGFRKGKAPMSLIEQKLNPNDVANEALDLAIRSKMPEVFRQAKCSAIAVTKIDVTKYVPNETAEYTLSVDVLPEIKLGDFKKLKAEQPDTTPSEADVQEIVDNIVKAYADKQVVQRAAKMGDEVIIDFTGKKDGEPFPGGSAKDYHLVLGSGQFIPGFEEGIVGHGSGDKFDLDITFPADYGEKSLAGQPTVFEVLVKQVNEVVPPKADDELAKKCGDFKSMTELRDDIKKNLQTQNGYRANEKYRDDLVQDLVKKSKVAAPEILIQDQLRLIKDDLARNAASRGLTFEQYLEQAGQTVEGWEKDARGLAEARVKASLVLQVLARDQKISATDEEVTAKVNELKDVYRNSEEAMKNLAKPEVQQDIRNRLIIDKTIDFLVEQNAPKAKKPTKKAAEKTKAGSTAKKSTTKKATAKKSE